MKAPILYSTYKQGWKVMFGAFSKFWSAVRSIWARFRCDPSSFRFSYHFLLQLRCVCDTSISLRKSRRAFLSLRESAMGEVPFVETPLKIMRMNTSINLFASICIILLSRWNMKHMCRRFVHVADARAIMYGPSLQKWAISLGCSTVARKSKGKKTI